MLFESPGEHIYLHRYRSYANPEHYERICLRTKTRRNIKQNKRRHISTSELAGDRGSGVGGTVGHANGESAAAELLYLDCSPRAVFQTAVHHFLI